MPIKILIIKDEYMNIVDYKLIEPMMSFPTIWIINLNLFALEKPLNTTHV